jgi:hypothetical protein
MGNSAAGVERIIGYLFEKVENMSGKSSHDRRCVCLDRTARAPYQSPCYRAEGGVWLLSILLRMLLCYVLGNGWRGAATTSRYRISRSLANVRRVSTRRS